jgi:hypothetical protein
LAAGDLLDPLGARLSIERYTGLPGTLAEAVEALVAGDRGEPRLGS